MQQSRFTEALVIGMITDHQAGWPGLNCAAAWALPCDVLQAGFRPWRDGPVRHETAEAAGGEIHQADASGGGCHARQYRAECSAGKALTTPMQSWDAVLRAQAGTYRRRQHLERKGGAGN